jgi:hypothetical protein
MTKKEHETLKRIADALERITQPSVTWQPLLPMPLPTPPAPFWPTLYPPTITWSVGSTGGVADFTISRVEDQ